jgi:hypothetical protein
LTTEIARDEEADVVVGIGGAGAMTMFDLGAQVFVL